jgi:hypothetical protein
MFGLIRYSTSVLKEMRDLLHIQTALPWESPRGTHWVAPSVYTVEKNTFCIYQE